MKGAGQDWAKRADAVVARLRERAWTLAVAESLTGGLLGAAITSVAGASVVFRGGIVAYATDVKAGLLDVPLALLAERGAVDPDVAVAMAEGARRRLAADVGVATTGVAGPDSADGKQPGTVHIAVATAGGRVARTLALTGGRDEIRQATVTEAMELLWSVVEEDLG